MFGLDRDALFFSYVANVLQHIEPWNVLLLHSPPLE